MINKNDKNLAEVFHFDLQGKREEKYDFLNVNSISSIQWNKLEPNEPNFFLVKKNFDEIVEYEKGFKVDELFRNNISGVQTGRDKLFIDFNKENLTQRIKYLLSDNILDKNFIDDYNINDSSSYNLLDRIKKCKFNENKIIQVNYKPFQKYYIYYDNVLIKRAFYSLFKNVISGYNLSLCLMRSQVNVDFFKTIFISTEVIDLNFYGFQTYSFPLYLYPETTTQQIIGQTAERTPNLNTEIVNQIAEKLGLPFVPEKDLTGFQNLLGLPDSFSPIDILDYIYAVLHSPTYREKYKEFLKIDFPRVPYPQTLSKFRTLTKLGAELRQIHLLESPTVERYITQYPIDGDNVVIKPKFVIANDSEAISIKETASCLAVTGKVYINDTQYFDKVPEIAWNFYIGGYQPAQKWLKDRKERKLEFEDILHYQKIIVALSETDRLMKEIDNIEIV